jgi:hypothetical protein
VALLLSMAVAPATHAQGTRSSGTVVRLWATREGLAGRRSRHLITPNDHSSLPSRKAINKNVIVSYPRQDGHRTRPRHWAMELRRSLVGNRAARDSS